MGEWSPEEVRFQMSVLGEPRFAAWVSSSAAAQSKALAVNISVVDTVLPEMRHMVDDYWYQFPPLNPLWHAILGFVIGMLGFVSITGNSMVIYIFSSTKSLRTPSNLLVVNLAFSDFLMMLTMSPPMVINCYGETWMLGRAFTVANLAACTRSQTLHGIKAT